MFESLLAKFIDLYNSSVEYIVLSVVVLVITTIFAQLTKSFMERWHARDHKYVKIDKTRTRFLSHVVTGMIYVVGIGVAVYMIPPLRALSVSIFAGAGVLAVVIGFASQQAFSNIVGGVFITIFRPFRVGDWIRVGTTISGTVEDINLRHTTIRNFENKYVVIPNSVISSEVVENAHLNDQKICKFIEIGISYDSDINLALKIMADEALKHPLHVDTRTKQDIANGEPIVRTKVLGFGESSINLRAWVWAEDPKSAFLMGCDLNKSIKERFDKEGVEIPFPYRTIVYKKDLPKNKKLKRKPVKRKKR